MYQKAQLGSLRLKRFFKLSDFVERSRSHCGNLVGWLFLTGPPQTVTVHEGVKVLAQWPNLGTDNPSMTVVVVMFHPLPHGNNFSASPSTSRGLG
jgi:hypothetical protein